MRNQHRAKVVNAARNYRLCASGAAHGGAATGSRSSGRNTPESADACGCVSTKLWDETLQFPRRLQWKWEGDSGVPGVVSVMQCGDTHTLRSNISRRAPRSWNTRRAWTQREEEEAGGSVRWAGKLERILLSG
ncbi:hypothetical protein Q5P01_022481 [Channa striata]|uniref:Uncharacterized protein n=1 Tax=Channa striata TaxID=64152 RepID=A0AA88LR22_CHASR|nr:hypothetical protein Q5P01_022481 [Channa striata]